jgi:hypothetical protein
MDPHVKSGGPFLWGSEICVRRLRLSTNRLGLRKTGPGAGGGVQAGKSRAMGGYCNRRNYLLKKTGTGVGGLGWVNPFVSCGRGRSKPKSHLNKKKFLSNYVGPLSRSKPGGIGMGPPLHDISVLKPVFPGFSSARLRYAPVS